MEGGGCACRQSIACSGVEGLDGHSGGVKVRLGDVLSEADRWFAAGIYVHVGCRSWQCIWIRDGVCAKGL
jgi:hypothetical protein